MTKIKTALPSRFGQSIIEIVLSIGLASMVIAALIILGSASLRTSTSASRRAEATKLANSGVEAIRFLRDSNGFNSLSSQIPRCYKVDGVSLNSVQCTREDEGWNQIDLSTSRSNDIFERKILVERYGPSAPGDPLNMLKVTSTVRWTESPGGVVGGKDEQRSVVVSTVLSKW